MPDKALVLGETLLRLARAQGECLKREDWLGFAALADDRQQVLTQLADLPGTPDVRRCLEAVLTLDEAHAALLTTQHADLKHHIDALRPQQAAVLAYYEGKTAVPPSARFIDRRN